MKNIQTNHLLNSSCVTEGLVIIGTINYGVDSSKISLHPA